jgi:large subunit ribosomal protein L31
VANFRYRLVLNVNSAISKAKRHEKDIHPEYHRIKVVMTDGTEFVTYSTYRAEGETLKLDIDSKTHRPGRRRPALIDRGGGSPASSGNTKASSNRR